MMRMDSAAVYKHSRSDLALCSSLFCLASNQGLAKDMYDLPTFFGLNYIHHSDYQNLDPDLALYIFLFLIFLILTSYY